MKKLAIIFVCTLFYAMAAAQGMTPDTATMHFIEKATIGGLQEVNSGRLAEEKADDPSLKAYGAKMVADHTKANNQLMQLVKSKGYTVPAPATVVTPDSMLQNTTGKAFDRNYVDMMVSDHNSTVYLFTSYATIGKDPDIKAFAQQTLPTLKEHQRMIKAIAEKMKTLAVK